MIYVTQLCYVSAAPSRRTSIAQAITEQLSRLTPYNALGHHDLSIIAKSTLRCPALLIEEEGEEEGGGGGEQQEEEEEEEEKASSKSLLPCPGVHCASNNLPDPFHTFLTYPRKLKCHHNTDMVPTNDANVRDPFVSSYGLSRQSPVPGTWPCQMRGQLRRCGHPWSCKYATSWSCFQPAFRSCLQQHDAEVSSTMAKKKQFLDKLQVL
jgi:hypothetical protein